ncbi:MAG: MFS transporter [Bacilli bacterium]|jgi:YQGE family putative transporter|nr:MFS transporter [Bacilli bacterium]HJJ19921.1 MFS transporter [Bacilli bacterium]
MKKKIKTEQNIIIIMDAIKKIMTIFLGPFLTAYFISTSTNSILNIAIYYIFTYATMALSTLVVAALAEKRNRIKIFRIGIILNFIYILIIILLKEKIINYLPIISILYGISASCYYFPYNLFIINKVKNTERTNYMVKLFITISVVGILFPIIFGSIITITNYILTAVIVLFISLIQIILSFFITDNHNGDLEEYNLKKAWLELKKNKQVINCLAGEFFIGMNICNGALETVMVILILNSFKTNINLGIITSIATLLSILVVKIYGLIYNKRDDKKVIIISSIIPVISLIIFLILKTNTTVIIYKFSYVIFAEILSLVRKIKIFNLSNSKIVNKSNQCEFNAIREVTLNVGRVTGYTLLLLAGLTQSAVVLNIVTIILTLSLLVMSINLTKVKKNNH